MQLLKALGLPIVGDKYPQISMLKKFVRDGVDLNNPPEEHKEKIQTLLTKKERIMDMNPQGFFEVPGRVMRGAPIVPDAQNGNVMKIIANGMIPITQNGRQMGTPPENYEKAILTYRNPKELAYSQQRLDPTNVQVIDARTALKELPESIFDMTSEQRTQYFDLQKLLYHDVSFKPDPTRFITTTGALVAWLADKPQALLDKFLPVEFDDTIVDPQSTVNAIVSHLGLTPTATEVQRAIDSVNTNLKRSQTFSNWDVEFTQEGALADELYDAIRQWTPSALAAWKVSVQDWFQGKKLEAVRWVDDEYGFDTFVSIVPNLYRSFFINNRGVLTYFQNRKTNFPKRFQDSCEHYSRDDQSDYTILVPLDILSGSMTRPHVACSRDNDLKTVEQCNFCWNRGWLDETTGTRYGPKSKGGEIITPE
jgi:hypothetical protein